MPMKALSGSSGVHRSAVFVLLLAVSGVCHADPPRPASEEFERQIRDAFKSVDADKLLEASKAFRVLNTMRPNDPDLVCSSERA